MGHLSCATESCSSVGCSGRREGIARSIPPIIALIRLHPRRGMASEPNECRPWRREDRAPTVLPLVVPRNRPVTTL